MPIESLALNAVSWPVLQEAPGRGQEVPEGVRHGESRHVVHSLPLEEGLPAFHRLTCAPLSRPRHSCPPFPPKVLESAFPSVPNPLEARGKHF